MQNKLQSFFQEVGTAKHKIACMRHNVNVISQVCAVAEPYLGAGNLCR